MVMLRRSQDAAAGRNPCFTSCAGSCARSRSRQTRSGLPCTLLPFSTGQVLAPRRCTTLVLVQRTGRLLPLQQMQSPSDAACPACCSGGARRQPGCSGSRQRPHARCSAGCWPSCDRRRQSSCKATLAHSTSRYLQRFLHACAHVPVPDSPLPSVCLIAHAVCPSVQSGREMASCPGRSLRGQDFAYVTATTADRHALIAASQHMAPGACLCP